MFEMGLWVWKGKQWTKCKAKLPLTSVMREQALRVQFTPFSVKSSILQLLMALNSLARQWKFERFWLHIFTRAKPISTKCISSKYTASWKLECFVESFLLKLISSGKAYNSQALWHPDSKTREWWRKYVEQMTGKLMFSVEWHCVERP